MTPDRQAHREPLEPPAEAGHDNSRSPGNPENE
jgi:hypothetical protein